MTDAIENTKRQVLLAEIVAAHGIRGEVVLRSFAADPANIASYGPLSTGKGARSIAVLGTKLVGQKVIARLAGVTDRNAAEALRGTQLFVARDRLGATEEGEFYHIDLIGLSALSQDGDEIGRVIAVQNFGAGDVLEIELKGARQTAFVPFTNEHVPEIDLDAGRVVVVMPAYAEAEKASGDE